MLYIAKWRPFITWLSPKEIVKEHWDQFNEGLEDLIEVTDPNNIHSVFNET